MSLSADFRYFTWLDEVEEALTYLGFSQTAGQYQSVQIHTQATNRLKVIDEALLHYKECFPWLVKPSCFEDWDESQHDEWLDYANSLDNDRRVITSRYLDCWADRYFVADVIAQLDINNTIDNPIPTPPDWANRVFMDERYKETVVKTWQHYIQSTTIKAFRARHDIAKAPGIKDLASNMLVKGTYASRRTQYNQRLHNAIDLAHNNGWYLVFDTLTLAPDKINAFFDSNTAIRDYFRTIGSRVSKADLVHRGHRNATAKEIAANIKESYAYFCVPEYGTREGRLHFHAVHFMRQVPLGAQDPNYGRPSKARFRRQIQCMCGLWEYGFNMPIAMRYSGDAFGSKLKWLWPVDKKTGKALDSKPPIAIARYVAKYVCKQVDAVVSAKGLNGEENTCLTTSRFINNNKRHFRIRMSRQFGLAMPSMSNLSINSLIQISMISSKAVQKHKLLKHASRRELKRKMAKVKLSDCLDIKPSTTSLLGLLRDMIETTGEFNQQSFTALFPPRLESTDVSNEAAQWLTQNGLWASQRPPTASQNFGGK